MAKHMWSGSCDPKKMRFQGIFQTFSVGIFEMVPRRGLPGTKRGKVKVRVSGSASDPDAVYGKARAIAEQLDAGTYTGPKTVRV